MNSLIINHFLNIFFIILSFYFAISFIVKILISKINILSNILFILLDILFIAFISLLVENIIYNFELLHILKINKIINNLTFLFLSSNLIVLLYFFLRFRLPGKAWELILVNKHSNNLDTFMVVIGLVFASAFGAITSFDIKMDYFSNSFYLVTLFFIFISINLVIMTILVFLSTYVINTMGNRKPIMFMLVVAIGISLLAQETLNFNFQYKKYLNKNKMEQTNATKK